MKMMQDLSIFVIIFLIKKKCTHLRSAITKANFEFLFQHRHFLSLDFDDDIIYIGREVAKYF